MSGRKRHAPTPGALRQTNELMREQMRMRMHALRREAAEIERWLAEHEPPIDNSDVEDAAHPTWPEFMERIKGQG
ncbi:hypothetical protein [Aquabacterium sp. OR-4]|uniref:hypothetical protein n=1 Tax=Aquabacterium sp. OR-4 TaxID=2978127 RepID=UPI0021B1F1C7|nr:hypothetical protein [Aquabacterium sp. OR-4]MDT7834993.1 hypothetical protein [Aquabacterium sp. OR-4]